MKNPHDVFFKESFSRKETVIEFIDNYLPKNIFDLIDTNSMTIEKDSYTDKEMDEYFSDIVYKVKIKGKESYISFLFEHKSYPAPEITFQILRYIVRVWDLKLKQGEKKLPLIIPLVIYHSQQKWNIGLKLRDITEEIPEGLDIYFPDFEYLLYDLSSYSDEEIKGYGIMRVYIEIIRSIYRGDFEERVYEAVEVLEKLEDQKTSMEYFESVMRYILEVKEGIEVSEIKEMVSQISAEKGEKVMTIAEKLRQEGIKEGIKEGKKKRDIEIALNMLKIGIDIEKIAEATNLDKEKINLIKEEIKH